jgi:hypothetical protein
MTETIKHTRAFKAWRDRVLHDDVWEHGKIRQWCMAVHCLHMTGQASGHATSLDAGEASDLVVLFWERWGEGGPRVTKDQAAIGRNWLASKGRRFGVFSDPEPIASGHDPAEITHFTFIGGKLLADNGHRPYSTPIYVAHWADGVRLRYWATPWQDGSDMSWTWLGKDER